MAKISRLALAVVIFWLAIVVWVFLMTQDFYFLLIGGGMVLLLYLIPLGMARLNRATFRNLADGYRDEATERRISELSSADVGTVITVEGMIEGQSLLWLARPRFRVSDGKGAVTAMMLFAPAEELRKGDRVRVLGAVSRSLLKPGEVAVTAFSIEKAKGKK